LPLAKGAPLSLRMTRGRPYSSNRRSNSVRTRAVAVVGIARAPMMYRLKASRTVNGSQRWPTVCHQPLKSTVHTSLGARATTVLLMRPGSATFRDRRVCTSPAFVRIRLQLLALGVPPYIRRYSSRILRGPQPRWACLRRTSSHTTASGTWCGLDGVASIHPPIPPFLRPKTAPATCNQFSG
jgi:hypothetical protein